MSIDKAGSEAVTFAIVHTKRHVHQLKNMVDKLIRNKVR